MLDQRQKKIQNMQNKAIFGHQLQKLLRQYMYFFYYQQVRIQQKNSKIRIQIYLRIIQIGLLLLTLFNQKVTQTKQNMFAGNTTNTGGFFGNSSSTTNTGAIFGGGTNQTQSQGGSIFGGGNQNSGGGMFGNTQGNTTTFGNTQQTNTSGIFGGNTPNQGGGGIFGGTTNTTNIVSGSTSTNTSSMFGGATSTNQNTGGIFGAPSNQNTSGSMFGAQQNTGIAVNTGNLFGGSTQNPQPNTGSIFGGTTTPQQQNPNGVGFFGNSTNTTNTGSMFGGNTNTNMNTNNQGASMFGANQNQNLTPSSMFNSPSSNQANTQGLGWGVSTMNQQQNMIGGINSKKFQPVKSKNAKIDAKHLVKCITGLDQNYNFCKNELRIRYMLTGQTSAGQSTATQSLGLGIGGMGQTQQQTSGNSLGFNNRSVLSFGAPNTNQGGSIFGNSATSNNTGSMFSGTPTPIGGTSPSPFGGNNTSSSIFGGSSNTTNTGSMFGGGNSNTGNTGMFGGGSNTTTSGMFGGNTSNTNQGGIFGNNFSGNSSNMAFGGNTGGNAGGNTGSLFGGNAGGNTNTGMFGNTNTGNTSGSMFGNNTSNTGNVFGGNSTNTGSSLFGGNATNTGNTQTGIFSFNNTANPLSNNTSSFNSGGGSLWAKSNTAGGMFTPTNTANNTGMFGNASSVPNTPNTNITSTLFGATQGLFNAAVNSNTNGNIFGNNAANTNTGIGNTGLFGGNNATNNTPNTGIFGGNNNNTGGLFGNNQQPNPLGAGNTNNNTPMNGLNNGLFGASNNGNICANLGNTNLFNTGNANMANANPNMPSMNSNRMSLTEMIAAAHFVNNNPQYFQQLKQSDPKLAYQLASLMISQAQADKKSYNLLFDKPFSRSQSGFLANRNNDFDSFENLSYKNPVTSILGSSRYETDSYAANRRIIDSMNGPVITVQSDEKNRRQAFDYDNMRFSRDPLAYDDRDLYRRKYDRTESRLFGGYRPNSSFPNDRLERNMDLLTRERALHMQKESRDREVASYYQSMYNDMANSLFSQGDQDAKKRAAFFKKYKSSTPYDQLMAKAEDQNYMKEIRKEREENQLYNQEMERSNIQSKNSSFKTRIQDDFILPRIPTESDYDPFGKIKKEAYAIPKPKVTYRPELRNFNNNKPILKDIVSVEGGEDDINKRVTYQDLPIMPEGYSIKPSLNQLMQITVYQLKRVKNVEISNSYGRIKYVSPINLYKKDIKNCLVIAQDTVDIKDPEWENKQAFLTFHNFGNYVKLDNKEKAKIQKKMKKWMNKMNMRLVTFLQDAGDLTVKI